MGFFQPNIREGQALALRPRDGLLSMHAREGNPRRFARARFCRALWGRDGFLLPENELSLYKIGGDGITVGEGAFQHLNR